MEWVGHRYFTNGSTLVTGVNRFGSQDCVSVRIYLEKGRKKGSVEIGKLTRASDSQVVFARDQGGSAEIGRRPYAFKNGRQGDERGNIGYFRLVS